MKPEPTVKMLGDDLYKIQHGPIVISFKFKDGILTLLDKDLKPKEFRFIESDIDRVWAVADTFKRNYFVL